MEWTITKRKKHNMDDEYYIVTINGNEFKFDTGELRHFIESLDSSVNCFGKKSDS